MKKIIISLLSGLYFLSTSASAEMGMNIGASGTMGLFGATAKETHSVDSGALAGSTAEDSEIAAVAYGSLFIEKELGMITLGVEYVPTAFESDTAETAKQDKRTDDVETITESTNKVQVDLENMYTLYVSFNVTDNAYVRACISSIDVMTNEDLGTGSSYGNTSLDGTVLGVGYEKDLNAGLFVRVEGEYREFDGVSLTSNDNTITLKSLDGVSGKVSIGKSF